MTKRKAGQRQSAEERRIKQRAYYDKHKEEILAKARVYRKNLMAAAKMSGWSSAGRKMGYRGFGPREKHTGFATKKVIGHDANGNPIYQPYKIRGSRYKKRYPANLARNAALEMELPAAPSAPILFAPGPSSTLATASTNGYNRLGLTRPRNPFYGAGRNSRV